MPNFSKGNYSDIVNAWFYTRHRDEICPADTVSLIVRNFSQDIYNYDLKICTPYTKFRDIVCEATCTMYHANLEHKNVMSTFRSVNKPRGWSRDIESIWIDHVLTNSLDSEFWNKFWEAIPVGTWESQFESYRIFIQSILPMYLSRDFDMMEKEGLIYQTEDGKYMTANEYEEYVMEERMYDEHT